MEENREKAIVMESTTHVQTSNSIIDFINKAKTYTVVQNPSAEDTPNDSEYVEEEFRMNEREYVKGGVRRRERR